MNILSSVTPSPSCMLGRDPSWCESKLQSTAGLRDMQDPAAALHSHRADGMTRDFSGTAARVLSPTPTKGEKGASSISGQKGGPSLGPSPGLVMHPLCLEDRVDWGLTPSWIIQRPREMTTLMADEGRWLDGSHYPNASERRLCGCLPWTRHEPREEEASGTVLDSVQ